MATPETPIALEIALEWAKSGRESDKVYRFLFLHPDDFFVIPRGKTWSIAHQVVYHGSVILLKRILPLFYDDQIDIRTLSADRKTLLDVATERQRSGEEMYNYVQQLFLQDDLIRAAKKNNWSVVKEILQNNPHLANEKPRYSTLFLLHYIVQHGDITILKDLFKQFEFDINVYSGDLETPLDLARRLRRNDMCLILEPKMSLTNERPGPSELPYLTNDSFPLPDLSMISLTISSSGSYQMTRNSLLSTITTEIQSPEVTDNPVLAPNLDVELSTPVTPTSKSQLNRNLKCPLTQEIFVDPVIATDGQTYERAAITEWIRRYECSPMTGERMNATFTDNIELRQLIQSLRG